MEDIKEKMLKRVRNLLDKAESTEYAEEAASLSAKAAKIMLEYGIDKALADAREDKTETPSDKVMEFGAPYADKKAILYFQVLKAFGGAGVYVSGLNRTSEYVRVYGFEADLLAVDIIYTSLLLQASKHTARTPQNVNARTWRVAFWTGFIITVADRFKEAKAEAVKATSAPGTEVVLRNRALEVQDAFRKANPRTKIRSTRMTARSQEGYDSGVLAGNRANLHNRGEAGQASRTAIG
jgi:Protein of unknown function (DUF2786)